MYLALLLRVLHEDVGDVSYTIQPYIDSPHRCKVCESPYVDHMTTLNQSKLHLVESVQGPQLASEYSIIRVCLEKYRCAALSRILGSEGAEPHTSIT